MTQLCGKVDRSVTCAAGLDRTTEQPVRPGGKVETAHTRIVTAVLERERPVLLAVVQAQPALDVVVGCPEIAAPECRCPHRVIALEQGPSVVRTLREPHELVADPA